MLRELNLRRELAVERDPARADDLRQGAAAARRVRYYRNFWGKNLNQNNSDSSSSGMEGNRR